MKGKRIKKVRQAIPNQLPFLFPIQDEDEHSTESSSFLRQSDKQNSSFYRELNRASPPYRAIVDKNPLKMQRHVSPPVGDAALPFRRRARSNSPPRNCLAIAERNAEIFPSHKPVLALRERKILGDSFSGPIFQKGPMDVDEDEDLKRIKEMYCQMIEAAKENGSDDEFELIQEEAPVNGLYHVNTKTRSLNDST